MYRDGPLLLVRLGVCPVEHKRASAEITPGACFGPHLVHITVENQREWMALGGSEMRLLSAEIGKGAGAYPAIEHLAKVRVAGSSPVARSERVQVEGHFAALLRATACCRGHAAYVQQEG